MHGGAFSRLAHGCMRIAYAITLHVEVADEPPYQWQYYFFCASFHFNQILAFESLNKTIKLRSKNTQPIWNSCFMQIACDQRKKTKWSRKNRKTTKMTQINLIRIERGADARFTTNCARNHIRAARRIHWMGLLKTSGNNLILLSRVISAQCTL